MSEVSTADPQDLQREAIGGAEGLPDIIAVSDVQKALKTMGLGSEVVDNLEEDTPVAARTEAIKTAFHFLMTHKRSTVSAAPQALAFLQPLLNGEGLAIEAHVEILMMQVASAVSALEQEELMRDPRVFSRMLLSRPLKDRREAVFATAISVVCSSGKTEDEVLAYLRPVALGFEEELAAFVVERYVARAE